MINRIKNEILNISYSKLYDLDIPWNTTELYRAACDAGFDGIKGDVTPSLDGKLIMCHDSHFAFDENGRVLEPGCEGVTEKNIEDMTYDECKSLEYALTNAYKKFGYYPKVAGLEDLISVCKEKGKFLYITVRDNKIDMCVDEVYRLLTKYDMTRNCIINSFSPDTLTAMRNKDREVCLSLVFGPDEQLTRKEVDIAASLGNCVVCVFWWKAAQLEGKLYEKSKDAIEYAKEKGVVLHIAHGADKESYKHCLGLGFRGFQCLTSDAFC